ncbi:MAG: DUF1579 domain-containing protein [Burkholderiales bacterium]|nr:DUF1579 domain-containing protein [Burkholderiales bacterium]
MVVGSTTPALAQERLDTAALLAAQREAMRALAPMNGVWRGPASTVLPNGQTHNITQTERIGPFLDGSIKVIEGRGFDPDGKATFNAFGVVSYDVASRLHRFHSHAQGHAGDFKFAPTPDGYSWEIPAGPMTIRYTATIQNGTLREVGDRIVPGREPVRFFEMNLKRIADTDWPVAGQVSPQ